MNKEIKRRWVEALRSGKYEQTTGCLKNDVGYCCLGVLTDLFLKDRKKGWRYRLKDDDEEVLPAIDCGTLPKAVMRWAELVQADPTVDQGSLAGLNDGSGWNFNRIADVIEKEL